MSLQVFEIKSSGEQDLAFAIRNQVFVEEQGVDPAIELDEHDNQATHFLAEWNGEPVGAARFRLLDAITAKVERVAVLKPYRGRHIGVKLMETIESTAKTKGLAKLKLNAQKHAEPFYVSLGYQSYGEPFDEAGIVHVAMEKKL
jgi:predicted GNAT family N-acyltransferase